MIELCPKPVLARSPLRNPLIDKRQHAGLYCGAFPP